jgi:hypothetical protein
VRKDGNQSTPAPVWFTMSADRAQLLIQGTQGLVEGQAHQAR